jgi:hypothetical protein
MKRGRKSSDKKIIPAADYPALLPPARRIQALRQLRSDEMLDKANRVILMKKAELRSAVMEQIERIEAAARTQNWPLVFELAHEIRGLAATAGLAATGQIANGLCRYLDTLSLLAAAPDVAVASLHLDAIVRSARTEDDAARYGATVADQLETLVERKLGEIKEAATV